MKVLCSSFVSFLLLTLGLTLSGQALPKGAVYQYDFSKNGIVLDLRSGSKVTDGVLRLNGKGAFAYIPKSGNFHFAEKGMTLAATVKLNYIPGNKALDNRVDMFFSKGKEFIFGKSGDKLYFNFHDGKTWCATTVTADGVTPQSGVWAHVAATVEYINDAAQGDVGYRVSIYLNGEKEMVRKFLYAKASRNNDLIELGKGFGGGPWFMNGDFANAVIYNRPLNAAEISNLCRMEKRVKVVRKGFTEISGALQKEVESFKKSASPVGTWFAENVLRAAGNGYDQAVLQKVLKKLTPYKKASLAVWRKEASGAAAPECGFVQTGDLFAAVLLGKGSSAHPVMGVLDCRNNREVFGESTFAFEIPWYKGKEKGVIRSKDKTVSWVASLDKNRLLIHFRGTDKKLPFEGNSVICFTGKRMESTLALRNLSQVTFDSVKYPLYNFASLGKGDMLAHPYMSGVLVNNPTEEQFRYGQAGRYPSGSVSMQFGAYYNARTRNGIYFGYEDGFGRTKNYAVEGKRSTLNVSWDNPMIADKGKNHFRMNGKAVIELYKGQWYEAGQIYRKFLAKDAAWWVRDLPRRSTPEWFRNNTLWILFNTHDRTMAEDVLRTFQYLRSYFGLPFGGHWYSWSDDKKMGWPHYPVRDFVTEIVQKMKKSGIRTVPYIDTRLWKVKDGPNNTDYMYKSHGLKYAAKNPAGGVYTETYGENSVFSIMCPNVKGWCDVMASLVQRVESYGFDGVYHDQVGTGRPRMCYDRSHGHLLNDASLWLEKGYWPMFDRFFAYLHKKNRSFCHTTEENAEPYLKQFDGYMVWRWSDSGQIPLYQSIYSGRAQFVGRVFNHSRPGERQSFFSKVGQQLVNSEQIGWFQPAEIRTADNRRLFVKKAMHLRYALLYYFNEGRMLAPVEFNGTMKFETPLWGGNDPQRVRMPVIANSAWEGQDGSRMWLFVNTQEKSAAEALPAVDGGKKGVWICREGASRPVFSKTAQKVKLSPLTSEVWVQGSRFRAEAVQKTLEKIRHFDAGKAVASFSGFTAKKLKGVPGKVYTVKDRSGNMYCSPTKNESHIGWVQDGALISYGTVDFGSKGAGSFSITVAVDGIYAGGTIEVMTAAPGQEPVVTAALPLRSTGGWNNFKPCTVKFKTPLRGKQQLVFRILGNAACNFASWSYSAQ